MEELNEEDVVIDLQSIGDKYEEKGYFRRLKDMFKGLGMPHNTPEYKLARIELQRQAAPLIAFVSVLLFVVILIVVTAMKDEAAEEIQITKIEQREEPEEPPPEEEPPPPPDPLPEVVEIEIDVPNPGPPSEMPPMPSPPSSQVSAKPAPVDSVAHVISPVMMRSMVSSRNPGNIGSRTGGGKGYGDSRTEACVLKVLWWLKATQQSNGSWTGGNQLANASLAVLTYLAHGEYPGSPSPYQKDFGPVVRKALEYIISCVDMNSQGARMKGSDGNEYAYLIATYALCEAYGMTKNPDVKDVAFQCLTRIVENQSPTGGWDYKLNKTSQRDDLSFAGWALQALKAGKMAGLAPSGLDACIKKAVRCLKTRSFHNGSFTYCANARTHRGLTGVGCLAMQLLGYGSDPVVKEALEYMREWRPAFEGVDMNTKTPKDCPSPQYYCYYAAQCKYQAGMKEGASKVDEETWYAWNKAQKEFYTSKIIDIAEKVKDWSGQDHKQGYYRNQDKYTSRPVMDSCLAALQLMVYYRYLPTTQTAAGKENTGDEASDASEQAVDSGDVGVNVDF